jgi:glycosyltransferase involved in cell wall biosynthesis
MNLTAIMPARNEGWVLGLSARSALKWCDALVVLDHASTDDTPELLESLAKEYPGRVYTISVDDPSWPEMAHRQQLLEFARAIGSTHIAPVDADEVLAGEMLPIVRGRVEQLGAGKYIGTPMRNLHRSIHQYRCDNSPFGSQAGTMLAFCDHPSLYWQSKDGYDHHQRSPHKSSMGAGMRGAGILHLQFASWRRLTAKHAWYKCMERLKYPSKSIADIEKQYSLAPNETGLQLADVPAEWWHPYEEYMHYLDLDRDPWQESAVRHMVADHGAEKFDGLNLYGVA